MIDNQGIQGLIVVRFWKPEDVNLTLSADELLIHGKKPIDQILGKNSVTDEGLRWLRGQVNKENKYLSKMGKMALYNQSVEGYQITNYARKTLIMSNGVGPYTLVQDGWWDVNEAIGSMSMIKIFTYLDGTTPSEAYEINYATCDLGVTFTKTNSAAMTISRYETITNI